MNYEINDRIIDDKRDLTIIAKRITGKKYHTKTVVKYLCNKCGYDCKDVYKGGNYIEEQWIVVSQLTRGDRCACCAGKVVSSNINSISKLRPDLIKYFYDNEDADRYSISSNKKVKFICPECNEFSKTISIYDFVNNSFNCPRCSDKISIGEKILYILLLDLQQDFIKEYMFDNSVYRYDFYLPLISTIIEVHGRQHYDGNFQTYKGGRSLSDEQKNDKIKYELALKNNIQNYIIIDARKSDFDFIQHSIVNQLSFLFDLTKVDWSKLKQEVYSRNIVKEISTYWDENPTVSFDEMSNKFHFCKDTIRKYLSIGESLGWCSSSTSINNLHYNNPYKYDAPNYTKPIKCIENNTYFKGSCLCSKVSKDVFGFKISDSTLRHILNGIKTKPRKVKYSFKYVSKEEFNMAIDQQLLCYGSKYCI